MVDPDATSNAEAAAVRKLPPPRLAPKRRNSKGQVKAAAPPLAAAALGGRSRTYSHDHDFDEGAKSNLVHSTPDQLELADTTPRFPFAWVAVSSKGTIVKIDTVNGKVLGEYRTAPAGQGTNPSRTTVDRWGNVWTANRDDASVVHVGLAENHQCIDRNQNGRIDTSTGLDDVLDWTNAGNADIGGGVSTAVDECILHYTLVDSFGARHVSVTADDDVWVSGTGNRRFDLIDGRTGAILRREGSVAYGGYGGLVDAQGVIWSARPLLRWDPTHPLTNSDSRRYDHDSYGLCLDSKGQVWNTSLAGNEIRRYAPDGQLLGIHHHGAQHAQGCAVDRDDHVWVAHSLLDGNDSVGHLLPEGEWLGNVRVGDGPTAVAVDAAGKIWATNYHSQTVSRIDPKAGALGSDGETPIGEVDFTTVDLGGALFDYGEMTGPGFAEPARIGTWTVVHDSTTAKANWGEVSWTRGRDDGGTIRVLAASSEDGVEFGPSEAVTNGVDLDVADGRYLRVTTIFERSSEGVSPILRDLTVEVGNEPPDCSKATPSVSRIWPARRTFVPVTIEGLEDPEADPVSVRITGILQDERLDTTRDGRFVPDGKGVGTAVARLRAERVGPLEGGNGRVYSISFEASDRGGRSCRGSVEVEVNHRGGAIDDGTKFDSSQIP